MVNTVTQRTLQGAGSDRNIIRMINIVSDGSEETDLVIYDNSTFINDVSKGRLEYIYIMGNAGIFRLEWDQSTDSPALSIDSSISHHFDFRQFGGIHNPNGTGATGDLLLTTNSLDSGDEVTLIFCIVQG